MSKVKQNCKWIPNLTNSFSLTGMHPDWEMHSDWIMAIESLDSYNYWVCEVVLPIAFQWIEENKLSVYKDIPENERDDVGVVIAHAFEIVKNMEAYKTGLNEYDKFVKSLNNNSLTTKNLNPVWSSLTKELRKSQQEIKSSYAPKLLSSLKEHQED